MICGSMGIGQSFVLRNHLQTFHGKGLFERDDLHITASRCWPAKTTVDFGQILRDPGLQVCYELTKPGTDCRTQCAITIRRHDCAPRREYPSITATILLIIFLIGSPIGWLRSDPVR